VAEEEASSVVLVRMELASRPASGVTVKAATAREKRETGGGDAEDNVVLFAHGVDSG
jgi:hypothetical protein